MTTNSRRRLVAALGAAIFLLSGPVAARAADPPAPGSFRAELTVQIADLEKKLVSLAEAVPAEKYAWRPGDGVRSTGEVYAHIAQSNYMIPSLLGVKVPEGAGTDMEKRLTKKADIVAALRKSFEHLRTAAGSLTDADLSRPVKLFTRESSVLGTYFMATGHLHEHLGQAIAYARMAGVVPPWTAERDAAQKQE
jgi:uncharacterized damage-inducible protein DinB